MGSTWLVVTLKVQDGKDAELEAVVSELAPRVRANEPDVPTYTFTKHKTEAGTYVFVENYLSAEARAAHGKTDYFRAALPKLMACLSGPPSIMELETVV